MLFFVHLETFKHKTIKKCVKSCFTFTIAGINRASSRHVSHVLETIKLKVEDYPSLPYANHIWGGNITW